MLPVALNYLSWSELLAGRFTAAEAGMAEAREIAALTGFRLVTRFKEGGYPAIEPRPRRPHSCSHETSSEVACAPSCVDSRWRAGRRSFRGNGGAEPGFPPFNGDDP
jgi:hypothetical protein